MHWRHQHGELPSEEHLHWIQYRSVQPVNYLDISPSPPSPSSEDNAIFTESSTDGFISGPISDAGNVVRLNDVVMPLSYADLMPIVQRRVGQEVMRCLMTYASQNNARYPWAASSIQAGPSSYFTTFADTLQNHFGHVPDTLGQTQWSGDQIGLATPRMAAVWPTAGCNIGASGAAPWWMNWKDLIYYAVAPAWAPNSTMLACTGSDCLTVNSGGNVAHVAVFVAGRAIGGELRTYPYQNTASNYLEGNNAATSDNYASWLSSNATPPPTPSWTFVFDSGPVSSTFNDTVIFQ